MQLPFITLVFFFFFLFYWGEGQKGFPHLFFCDLMQLSLSRFSRLSPALCSVIKRNLCQLASGEINEFLTELLIIEALVHDMCYNSMGF